MEEEKSVEHEVLSLEEDAEFETMGFAIPPGLTLCKIDD